MTNTARTDVLELADDLDEFFGYREDVQRVREAVAQRPLVTLVGPGGSGKSRVALQVARTLLFDGYAVAGWITPEDLADVERIERRIEEARTEGRPSLLVVDGCEQVVRTCAQALAALAAQHPDVHLLATSREALRAVGELVHPINGLPVPPLVERLPDLDVVRHFPAVRLFLDRAQSTGRSITLTIDNALQIVEICRGLDGNPLAIELAASLTVALSLTAIANRLDQSLHLLTRGYRTARPHQHSLQASLDHSISLLSEPARELLNYLAIFSGNFTLSAVEAVCASAVGMPAADRSIIDMLIELVDKRIVIRAHDWFRLPSPVRHFAQQSLRRSGRHDSVAAQHTAWCGWLAERITTALDTSGDITGLALLDQENENLTAALHRTDHADPHHAAQIAGVMVRFWLRHDCAARYSRTRPPQDGHRCALDRRRAADYHAARSWLEQSLAGDEPAYQPGARTTKALHLAVLTLLEGDHHRARIQLRSVCAELTAIGRGSDAALARCALAISSLLARHNTGDDINAQSELKTAIALYQAAGDDNDVVFATAWLALATLHRGDTTHGRHLLFSATTLVADSADDAMAAALIAARARVRLADGRHRRALELAGAEAAVRTSSSAHAEAGETHLDPDLAAAWRALGSRQALDHWNHGAAMSVSEALNLAADDVPHHAPRSTALLTPRELEVVRMVAQGMTSVKIAREFVISPRTVDTHVDHIRTKLGLHSRAQVAAWASNLGIT